MPTIRNVKHKSLLNILINSFLECVQIQMIQSIIQDITRCFVTSV